MKLNEKQKKIAVITVCLMACALIFPPFYIRLPNGVETNMGYGFLLDPPTRGYTTALINISTLVLEWIMLALLGGLGVYLKRESCEVNSPEHENLKEPNKLVGVKGWLLLFCISLTILSPLKSISNAIAFVSVMKYYFGADPLADALLFIETLMYVGLSVMAAYAGYSMWSVKPNALKLAKSYLYVMLSMPLLIGFIDGLLVRTLYIDEIGLLEEVAKSFLATAFAVAVWLAYLSKSVRVQNTYASNSIELNGESR